MWKENVIAILVADIHLSLTPPIARSGEKDWLEVQKRYLNQLAALAGITHGPASQKVPVIVAGDVFDRWNVPAELVNFAIDFLPKMHAIPGQHDLPYHSYGEIRKSAYFTLVKAGKIVELFDSPIEMNQGTPIRLWGFPFGYEVNPLKKPHDLLIEIAVIHSFIWTEKTGYPGAPKSQRLSAYKDKLKGYNIAVFGDNHKPFHCKLGRCEVMNVGGFMRRKSDERNHKPSVGLLYNNGTIKRRYLDVSADKFLNLQESLQAIQSPHRPGDGDKFLKELESLGDTALNFPQVVREYLDSHKVKLPIRRAILEALELAKD